jgi:hypothetical protein
VKLLKDPAAEAVKEHLTKKGATRCYGDTFEALLVGSGEGVEVDASKFLDLYAKGRIKRAQLVGSIKVSVEKARELLSAADFQRVTHAVPAAKRLTPRRIKDEPVDLVAALTFLRTSTDGND